MSKPSVPRINLNGTAGHVLLFENSAALAAVNAAIDALHTVTVHGRDYQTLPAGSFQVAWGEHRERLGKLMDVKRELEHIVERLQAQLPHG